MTRATRSFLDFENFGGKKKKKKKEKKRRKKKNSPSQLETYFFAKLLDRGISPWGGVGRSSSLNVEDGGLPGIWGVSHHAHSSIREITSRYCGLI